MILSYNDLYNSKITLFDKSISLKNDWESGLNTFIKNNNLISFNINDKPLDINFDVIAKCKWVFDKGDYSIGESDFFDQSDIDVYISINEIISDVKIDENSQVYNFLKQLIISNI